jgi:prevent-host-death family protein
MGIEETGEAAIITRYGKPILMLLKASGRERGKKETVSNLRNNATKVLAEAEKSGKRLIITRDGVPVAVLSRVTDDAFSVDSK